MVTILIFSLVFAHTRLIRRDLGDYKCHVENASETAGHIRSLDVFLQAPGIAATEGKLSRRQKVSTLECFSHRSSVQVNLLHLEKLHRDLAEWAVEKCTLQSIEVITTAVRAPARNHSCVLLTPKRKKFHRKFVLRGKEGITPRNDKGFMIRKKISIIIKVIITCVLLVCAIWYILNVICEFPCSCLCLDWMAGRQSSSRSVSTASEPLGHQPGTLLTQILTNTKEKSLQSFA
ncbi:uncharacterized protein C17orf78 homolog isoform X2 [Anas acuta]|uniref:uncharacterized protein C17orf78 homolog isoform X2 n=1 Tax=Anas acuta TaxID=28680 RepID=UPI0035C8F64B